MIHRLMYKRKLSLLPHLKEGALLEESKKMQLQFKKVIFHPLIALCLRICAPKCLMRIISSQ